MTATDIDSADRIAGGSADIINVRIKNPKIINGRVVDGEIVEDATDSEALVRRQVRARSVAARRMHDEVIAVIGLALVVLVWVLLR
jgi:hypothetical protein